MPALHNTAAWDNTSSNGIRTSPINGFNHLALNASVSISQAVQIVLFVREIMRYIHLICNV